MTISIPEIAELRAEINALREELRAPRITEKRLLCVKEAAGYLGIPENQIRKMITQNSIPYTRMNRRVYFTRAMLDEWIEQNRGKK